MSRLPGSGGVWVRACKNKSAAVEGRITRKAGLRRWVRQIEDAAKAYAESSEDTALLYRGLQLALAENSVRGRERQLSDSASQFLEANRSREDKPRFVGSLRV